MIDADDPFPYRILEPLPAAKNGRCRTRIVREFKTEAEAAKELARLVKAGDSRPLFVEKLARGRRPLGTFATKKEAEKAERDALSARDRGIDVAPTNLKFEISSSVTSPLPRVAAQAERQYGGTARYGSGAVRSRTFRSPSCGQRTSTNSTSTLRAMAGTEDGGPCLLDQSGTRTH